jgi:hypothetical protein
MRDMACFSGSVATMPLVIKIVALVEDRRPALVETHQEIGERQHRIAPIGFRHRAGMACLPDADDLAMAKIAAYARDYGGRDVAADQKRSLLDMKLDISADAEEFGERHALADLLHRQADIGHVLAEHASVAAMPRVEFSGGERSRQYLGAEIAGAEPCAFLATHREHVHRRGEAAAAALGTQQAEKARDDAREPIVIAAEGNAVDMRSDEGEPFRLALAGKREIGVQSGIIPDLQPLAPRKSLEILERPRLDRREGRTADAFRIRRHCRDLAEQPTDDLEFRRMIERLLDRMPDRGEAPHGAASMKTTFSPCSSSITVPMSSRTEESPSAST